MAQKSCPSRDELFNKTFTLSNVERFSSSVHVKGDIAFLLLDRLLGTTRQPAYKYNVKNVKITGIESSVKFKILVGVHGYEPKLTTNYFHYCKNENELDTRLNKQNNVTKRGIVIYFKINGSDVISKEHMGFLLVYLKSLVD